MMDGSRESTRCWLAFNVVDVACLLAMLECYLIR